MLEPFYLVFVGFKDEVLATAMILASNVKEAEDISKNIMEDKGITAICDTISIAPFNREFFDGIKTTGVLFYDEVVEQNIEEIKIGEGNFNGILH